MKIKNLKFRKISLKSKVFTFALATAVVSGGTVIWKTNDEKDKIVLKSKGETTLHQLSKKLDYDYDKLKELNKKIDSCINDGQEIVIRISDLEDADFEKYKIAKEDNLSKIASKYGVSSDSLEKMDERLESDEEVKKHIGEYVSIYKMNEAYPQTIKYTVESGDSLLKIVNKINKNIKNHISIENICEENNISNSDTIYVNQELKITVEATDAEIKKILKIKKKSDTSILTGKKAIEKKYGKLRGIDIYANTKVDWKKLSESGKVDFVIIKMFDGFNVDYNKKSSDGSEGCLNNLDKKFFENVENCKKYNIPFGIYVYSRATTEKMAQIEAEKVVSILGKADIRPTYPVYWDIESLDRQPLKKENGQEVSSVEFISNNPNQVVANFKAFADVLESNNYYCGIYTNQNAIAKIDPTGDKLKQYAVWYSRYVGGENSFSNYTVKKDGYNGNIGMYQFTDAGRVTGITGYVDCNYCKYDYSKIIKDLGMNIPVKSEKNKNKAKKIKH